MYVNFGKALVAVANVPKKYIRYRCPSLTYLRVGCGYVPRVFTRPYLNACLS